MLLYRRGSGRISDTRGIGVRIFHSSIAVDSYHRFESIKPSSNHPHLKAEPETTLAHPSQGVAMDTSISITAQVVDHSYHLEIRNNARLVVRVPRFVMHHSLPNSRRYIKTVTATIRMTTRAI
jgi:hypothetical protein